MPQPLLSSDSTLFLFHHTTLLSAEFPAVFGAKAGSNGNSRLNWAGFGRLYRSETSRDIPGSQVATPRFVDGWL
jgi:hypothetical protein